MDSPGRQVPKGKPCLRPSIFFCGLSAHHILKTEMICISPFQQKKENLQALSFLNCNCISPESPGRRLIEVTVISFLLERAYVRGGEGESRRK
jgi:hypothetical protein